MQSQAPYRNLVHKVNQLLLVSLKKVVDRGHVRFLQKRNTSATVNQCQYLLKLTDAPTFHILHKWSGILFGTKEKKRLSALTRCPPSRGIHKGGFYRVAFWHRIALQNAVHGCFFV